MSSIWYIVKQTPQTYLIVVFSIPQILEAYL